MECKTIWLVSTPWESIFHLPDFLYRNIIMFFQIILKIYSTYFVYAQLREEHWLTEYIMCIYAYNSSSSSIVSGGGGGAE